MLDVNLSNALVYEWFVRPLSLELLTYDLGIVWYAVYDSLLMARFLATGCNITAQIYDTKSGQKVWCVQKAFSSITN